MDSEPPQPTTRRRTICPSCCRPKPVCLCHVIPHPPVQTATRIIIVQHPHELKHKLNTTPLLTKSLLKATSFVSRRICADDVRKLMHQSESATSSVSGDVDLSGQKWSATSSIRDCVSAVNSNKVTDQYRRATSFVPRNNDDINKLKDQSCDATSVVSRDEDVGSSRNTDSVDVKEECTGELWAANVVNTNQSQPTLYYLFPPSQSSPAVKLSEIDVKIERSRNDGKKSWPDVVLIVFDATWEHAKEMVKASQGYLSEFATRVCLDGYDAGVEGGNIFNSELLLRKEPFSGCVSTLEAVARWIGVVEKNGPEIEERLLRVLRQMVLLQAQFRKPVKPRPKMGNKGKLRSEGQN